MREGVLIAGTEADQTRFPDVAFHVDGRIGTEAFFPSKAKAVSEEATRGGGGTSNGGGSQEVDFDFEMVGAGREAGKGGCVVEQTMSTCTSADRDGSSLLVPRSLDKARKESTVPRGWRGVVHQTGDQ